MLGRKQTIRNDADWAEALEHVEEIVSKDDLDKLMEQTVEEIRASCSGKQAAFAWSAGKDSIVLREVCERAGIKQCVLVICDLEYPAFLSWVTDNMPDELEVINTGQDLDWLAAHQNMLFPQDSAIAAKWFHMVQHRGQEKYYKAHGLEMLLLGRRKADGNYVGRGSNIYTNASGMTRYSPISEWRHEDILAFLHYYKPALPPFYGWKNGFYCGTHPWAARQWTGSIENGWSEVYGIDPDIVRNAAEKIPSAEVFLKERDG